MKKIFLIKKIKIKNIYIYIFIFILYLYYFIINIMNSNISKEFYNNPIEFSKKLNIKQLEKLLTILSNAYYNSDNQIVSDEVFDDIVEILKEKNPNSKFFNKVGADENDNEENIGKKVKLPFPMFSLDKVKPKNINDLDIWINKYNPNYVIASHKLDGMSGLIYKDKNGNIKLYSRGNGIYGRDITVLLKYIQVNTKNIPNDCAVRGELIISKDNFKDIESKFTNARAAVAGMINGKKIEKEYVKLIEFVAYSIVYPLYKKSKQLELIKKYNIQCVNYEILKKDKLNKNFLIKYFTEERKISKFNIDGIVINDDKEAYEVLEENDPTAFAFKCEYDGQSEITEILDIEWNISRHGYLKPTAILKPVEIDGTIINRATLHNARFVVDNNINKGTIIKLVKSGDVIPYISTIIKSSNSPLNPKIKFKWNDTQIDYIVDNDDEDNDEINNEQIKKQLTHFMEVLNVKYFKEGYIERLVNRDLYSIEDIINNEDILIEEIGENMGQKIYNNLINKLKNTKLTSFMYASGCFGRGIGLKKLDLIYKQYPNILDINESDLYDLIINIEGIQDKTADIFIDGLKQFKKFFKSFNDNQNIIDLSYLLKEDNNYEYNNDEITNDEFIDKKVCLTGFRDNNIKEFIEKNKGNIVDNVSKNTYMVIVKDNNSLNSSKSKKAKELNLNILTKEEFYNNYLNNLNNNIKLNIKSNSNKQNNKQNNKQKNKKINEQQQINITDFLNNDDENDDKEEEIIEDE